MTEPQSPPPKPPEPQSGKPDTARANAPVQANAPVANAPARPATPQPTAPRPTAAPISGPAKPAEKPVERETVPPTPPSRSRALPVLYFLGFVILAGAIAWIWKNPPLPPEAPTGALQAQLDSIETRLAQLKARPPEPRPVSDTAPAFNPAPLLARIAALEARQPPAPSNLAPIEARIAALEARPTTSAVDAALSERIGRVALIQSAAAALEAGHKLGSLPGAPPALQLFADADPPTEAGLRLAFPTAARAALVASRPIDPELPWLSRIWGRLQELITIRQGERVLVGDPAAGVVAAAQHALDAGDLAGAVAALARLNPPAAQAMSGWIGQAKTLLEARAALAAMAARG